MRFCWCMKAATAVELLVMHSNRSRDNNCEHYLTYFKSTISGQGYGHFGKLKSAIFWTDIWGSFWGPIICEVQKVVHDGPFLWTTGQCSRQFFNKSIEFPQQVFKMLFLLSEGCQTWQRWNIMGKKIELGSFPSLDKNSPNDHLSTQTPTQSLIGNEKNAMWYMSR